MVMVSPQEEVQIAKMLAKYHSAAATKKDVLDVLHNYQALSYRLDKYVFNDGIERELFMIHGTVPVMYKNSTYHIPVCIWLMDSHPNNAPLCYVKPTADMHIKVSMYVDGNGKIYLPYLHDWQPYSSDLLGLIQVMIVTFGEYPPVYSNPKESPYPNQSAFMPQPPGGSYNLPYPTGGNNFPPYPTSNSFGGGFPPYPPVAGGNQQNGPGYPPYPQPNFAQNPSGYNSNFGGASNTPTAGGTITEEHIKLSLISAVEDKLRRRIQERVNQCQAEIETLQRTKMELNDGRGKIFEIISKLEREESELKRSISVLQDKDQELEKSLESLEKMDGIDVDDAVITTSPLYRQLLNSYSEEAAIEDAIYYLGEALRNGVIDLEVFLKHVRQLSRKQFMLRALMQKCRQKAGLAG